jgi:ABC-type multidrug transport system fused ATPase/permease subunit
LVLDLTATGIAVILVTLAFKLGSMNQAALGLGLLKVMQIGSDLGFLVEWWASLETSLGAVSRVRAFEQETPQEADGEAHTTLTLPENWPQHGHIEVLNVSADYTVDDEDYRALHELTVDIAAGTKVGLVGHTGSGKTSFLLTLLCFLKFTGSITIDGVDVTKVPRHVLQSRITTISQELMELPCSVRDNLVPREIAMATEDRIDDAKLLDVLAKAGLRQLIENRGGLDAALCDIGLSAGEQQLFALARALVHHDQTKSKVIFVDEATSYIDYECEEKLQDITTEAFEDCTVLTIAHRYHTIQNTTLLELSSGRLVSYG